SSVGARLSSDFREGQSPGISLCVVHVSMKTLRQRTLSGLGWNAATQLLGQILQFAGTAVLAHLLSPADFGLISMILILTGFASNFADMGLSSSIIHERAISDLHLNSVFFVNIALGGSLAAFFIFASPLISSFYGKPQLKLMTIILAANFLIGSL